jgi:hypothetical protein
MTWHSLLSPGTARLNTVRPLPMKASIGTARRYQRGFQSALPPKRCSAALRATASGGDSTAPGIGRRPRCVQVCRRLPIGDWDDHGRLPHGMVEMDMSGIFRASIGSATCTRRAIRFTGNPDMGDLHRSEPPLRRRSCRHRLVSAAWSSQPPNERGVGVPPSRSLATASRASPYIGRQG